ncbi:hypothetical protein TEA_020427 [Camellia sinensis var. sinensis]|uniref:B box-type domain-containing protein n=1 Tax=Camellia sinensis var. sinensis TaxID=542762 RepID=A0A4S4CWJ0_CAMSN|nr:hypothetical protein TEA_020427 [Camellia sinensis var. sinensis]
MLKHSKILFMDEATASVDSQTDVVIQKTIREDFVLFTIISIAHRIPTVMDCDKVMVMDAGWAREYEAPSQLLERPWLLAQQYSNYYAFRGHEVYQTPFKEGKKRGSEKLDQTQVVHRKSIDAFGQRTSQYRGVTRHRWTDAAYLCLSCDAKVHSANALSNRHPRTPVCEACRYRPAHVRCSDHRMFMCHGCDCSLHKDSSQHQKQVISSFMGCPSAKDFAVLWGFELNKLENSTLQNQFVLTSCVSVDTGVKNSNFPRQSMSSPQTGGPSLASQASTVTSILGAEYEVGLSSQHTEVFNKGKQQQDTCIILQQIFDLERLQLTEGDKNSSLIRGKQTTDISSSTYDTSWKLDQSFQHSLGLGADPHQELNVEYFSSPFPPLENLTLSSTVGNHLQGEPLWQCRSPTQSFQV